MNNLAICNEHKRVWDKNNPEKVKAQQRVSSHPDKVIIIYECGCNYPKKEEHHPDYSKPLEVCKLCRTCHIEEHKRLKRL